MATKIGSASLSAELRAEPGSFRDRNGHVYYRDDAVLRGLSAPAMEEWNALVGSEFFARNMAAGRIVQTRRVEPPGDEQWATQWAGWLEHKRIPFVSYPYEWSFSMLKDAAVLQLELLLDALAEDTVVKDATAYNVQWTGSWPVFIDIPSFERLRSGEPWTGYRQFCELLLYPLLLQAYKGIPFHPWLRGRLDGVTVEDCWRAMSWRDLLRPGVLTHVYLQHVLQARYGQSDRRVKDDLRKAGFDKQLIVSNARGLLKLVRGLRWQRSQSAWSDYADNNSYTDMDRDRKIAFVREALAHARPKLVWDLGCNTGTYSRIAAEYAEYVVAMDADHLAVERLYLQLKSEGLTSVLPIVNNLSDPSPRLGWHLAERKALEDRGKPDVTLALALIHHLVLGANIPLRGLVEWLAELQSDVIIEFVDKDDPMAQGLLRNKVDNYADYTVEHFESLLATHFTVEKRERLASGTRTLYYARYGR